MASAEEGVGGRLVRERMSLKMHSNNVTCTSFWKQQDLACSGTNPETPNPLLRNPETRNPKPVDT